MRDRLIELLEEAKVQACATVGSLNHGFGEWYADYLIANGVIVPPYKPFPLVLSEDENSSDVFCPFCDTNLSGHYYGGGYEPPKIAPCFECGTWLDMTKAITREEAEQALQEAGGQE